MRRLELEKLQRTTLGSAVPRKTVLAPLVLEEWKAAEALHQLRSAPAVISFTLALYLDVEHGGGAIRVGSSGQGRYGAGWLLVSSAEAGEVTLQVERGVSATVQRAVRGVKKTRVGADVIAGELLAEVREKAARYVQSLSKRGTR